MQWLVPLDSNLYQNHSTYEKMQPILNKQYEVTSGIFRPYVSLILPYYLLKWNQVSKTTRFKQELSSAASISMLACLPLAKQYNIPDYIRRAPKRCPKYLRSEMRPFHMLPLRMTDQHLQWRHLENISENKIVEKHIGHSHLWGQEQCQVSFANYK